MIGAGDSIKHLLVQTEIGDSGWKVSGLETDFRSGGLHTIRVLLANITMACRYTPIYTTKYLLEYYLVGQLAGKYRGALAWRNHRESPGQRT